MPGAVILGVKSHGQAEVLTTDNNLTDIVFVPVLSPDLTQ